MITGTRCRSSACPAVCAAASVRRVLPSQIRLLTQRFWICLKEPRRCLRNPEFASRRHAAASVLVALVHSWLRRVCAALPQRWHLRVTPASRHLDTATDLSNFIDCQADHPHASRKEHGTSSINKIEVRRLRHRAYRGCGHVKRGLVRGPDAVPPTRTASGMIFWRCAAAERTRSHSGSSSFGILLPEVIALRVGIAYLRRADAENSLGQPRIRQQRPTQFRPIRPLAARDDVVNRREGQVLVIQVAVKHAKANATGKLVGREGLEPSTKRLRGSSRPRKPEEPPRKPLKR